jgi:hypothetical protein
MRRLDECRRLGIPLRVQLQPPFPAPFDAEGLAQRLAERGVKAANVVLSDPFLPAQAARDAEEAAERVQQMNALVRALDAGGIEANLYGLPLCHVAPDNRARAGNSQRYFLDHQQYNKSSYDLARLLYHGSPNVASILIAFGAYRLRRHRHPRFGGMQVGFRDLTIWSFLMASAHGAGFMVLPLVIGMTSADLEAAGAGHAHAAHSLGVGARALWTARGIHTAAYRAVTAVLAWIVYTRVGVAILRTVWYNPAWLWACALVIAGAVVLID